MSPPSSEPSTTPSEVPAYLQSSDAYIAAAATTAERAAEFWLLVGARERDRNGPLHQLHVWSYLAFPGSSRGVPELLANVEELTVDELRPHVDGLHGICWKPALGDNGVPSRWFCGRVDSRRSDNGRWGLPFDFLNLVTAYEAADGLWVRDVDCGEPEAVMRVRQEAGCEFVEVNRKLLRQVLGLAGAVLVRHHVLFVIKPAAEIVPLAQESIEPWPNAIGWVRRGHYDHTPGKAWDNMHVKDMVSPVSSSAVDERYIDGETPRGALPFIYDVDSDGEPLLDDGTEGWELRYARFSANVLDKYRRRPNHDVDQWGVSGPGWSIDATFNEDTRVIEALCVDLHRLPLGEQQHWKAHNIVPAGPVSTERLSRDTLSDGLVDDEFHDTVSRFRAAHQTTNEASRQQFGDALFDDLAGGDVHVWSWLRVPESHDMGARDEVLIALGKILGDKLNNALIQRLWLESGESLTGTEAPRGLALAQALAVRLRGAEEAGASWQALRDAYALRSTGAGHARGSNWKKSVTKVDLDESNAATFVEQVLRQLTEALPRCLQSILPDQSDATPSA